MKLHEKAPFYRQLIAYASDGFTALDEISQAELRQFILKQQSDSGGFCDRAGIPDTYYSLFGFFLARASGMEEVAGRLFRYTDDKPLHSQTSLINRCCLAIVEKEKPTALFRSFTTLAAILKGFFSETSDINRSYQYFMVFMAFDAYGLNNWVTRLLLKPLFSRQISVEGLPCPVVAASIVLKYKLGLPVREDVTRLLLFFDEEKGFKSFEGAPAADMLSTAVALVALKMTSHDLRMVRPACLALLEMNFNSGAFLAGNGDWERDTEYTFYGLMALGLLT